MDAPLKHYETMTATEITNVVADDCDLARDIVEQSIQRIQNIDPIVDAWVHFDPTIIRQSAEEQITRLKTLDELPPLAGVPMGVKDVFNTRLYPTEMGSAIWKGFTPGNDARVVEVAEYNGAVLMGKTHTAEFAVHAPGPTKNPYDLSCTPGTSSSGSAVAVATGMVPIAFGTQTAGSTIRPASYCGVFGFKPSFGLLPRTAVLKTTDTLDHVTVFARSVEDVGLAFDTVRVRGSNYPFVEKNVDQRINKPADGTWKIALVKGPRWDAATPFAQSKLLDIAQSVSNCNGIEVNEIALPSTFDDIHDLHELIYCKSLSYYFKEEAKQRDKLSDSFLDMIDRGETITADAYKDAMAMQSKISQQLTSFFDDYDAILTLSAGDVAPAADTVTDVPDNCLVWTFCGTPALNIPTEQSPSGLPIGVQLVASKYADYDLLNLARRLGREGVLPNQVDACTPRQDS